MRIRFLPAILAIALAVACDGSSGTTPVTAVGYTVTSKTPPPVAPEAGTSIPLMFMATEDESDGSSRPAAGKSITVTVTSGGGTINGTVTSSGGPFNGVTTATQIAASDGSVSLTWVLGRAAGPQSVRAAVASSDHFVDVSVIASVGPAARLGVAVQPSPLAVSGVALTLQPTVRLEDAGGNAVVLAGVPVTASIATGGGTVGGTATVNSDATGLARFTDLSLSGVAGAVTLKFAAPVNGQATTVTSSAISVRIPWTPRSSLPTPSDRLAVGVVNGILYAVGGIEANGVQGTVQAYDPSSNSWTTKASLPTPRFALAVGVVNGILYAVGGFDGVSFLGTVEAYNPLTNSWTTKASMPTPRSGLAVGVVNGILYAMGGDDYIDAWEDYSSHGIVEAYDPITDSWTTTTPMPLPREDFSLGVVNGILYAAGGGTNEVDAYDPAVNRWTIKASTPTPARFASSVGVINGILYLVGGYDDASFIALGTVDAYDPASDLWTTPASALTPRSGLAVGTVNGTLYAVGGYNGSPLGIVEAYVP